MQHPWRALPATVRRGLLKRTTILAILLTIFMARIGAPLDSPAAPLGIVSLELARTPEKMERILHEWTPRQEATARRSVRLDFTYLVVYALALSLACAALADAPWLRQRAVTTAAAALSWGSLLAGALDAVENAALLAALRGAAMATAPPVAFAAASLKFALVAAALLLLATGGVLRLSRTPEHAT